MSDAVRACAYAPGLTPEVLFLGVRYTGGRKRDGTETREAGGSETDGPDVLLLVGGSARRCARREARRQVLFV